MGNPLAHSEARSTICDCMGMSACVTYRGVPLFAWRSCHSWCDFRLLRLLLADFSVSSVARIHSLNLTHRCNGKPRASDGEAQPLLRNANAENLRLSGLDHTCGEAFNQKNSLHPSHAPPPCIPVMPPPTCIPCPHASRIDTQVLSIIYMGLGATTAVNLRAVSGSANRSAGHACSSHTMQSIHAGQEPVGCISASGPI